jgi:hypothetical protein
MPARRSTIFFAFFAIISFLLLETSSAETKKISRLAAPDTTCREAYEKNPTKDGCLDATDFYGRPCLFCIDGDMNYCYTVDEARWAKIFGARCDNESGPFISSEKRSHLKAYGK